ncbi:MAG: RNA-binding protein [Oscillospiraceae bacterium]|nr:RNA-binding protein [Oscillospiraceae bacterium]
MVDLSRLTGDEKLFCAHIEDLIERCEKKYIPQFTHFLDERQVMIAQQVMNRVGWQDHIFWGGYPEAGRSILGVFPPYSEYGPEDFPLQPITFSYRAEDSLSHRDFLGSLMALQIKREALGDILVGKGSTVVFTAPAVASLIVNEVKKVGSVGVKVSDTLPEKLPAAHEFQNISGTVSSLRLDCVASLVTKLSREKAAQLIRSGLVMVDHAPCIHVDYVVKEGEKLSIRGHGKYMIGGTDGLSKKGRIRLTVQKYI